jgi:HEPN domain-containing protein
MEKIFELLENPLIDDKDAKWLNKTIKELEKALEYASEGDYNKSFKCIEKAIKNLLRVNGTGIDTEYIIELLLKAVRDKTLEVIISPEFIIDLNDSLILEIWNDYSFGLKKLGEKDYITTMNFFINIYNYALIGKE